MTKDSDTKKIDMDNSTSSEENYKFQKLTPVSLADNEFETYQQQFEFAFDKKNSDLKNIAMIGNLGSGKSSILKTMQEKFKNRKFINISLLHLGNTEKPIDDITLQQIELSILQQLLLKVPSNKIPNSKFERIEYKSKFDLFRDTFLYLAIFIFIILGYINFGSLIKPMLNFSDSKFQDFANKFFIIVILSMGILSIIAFIIYQLLQYKSRYNLKKN